MKKILVATDKPFAPAAITQIKQIIEEAGFQLELLEKYTDKSQLTDAVSKADAVIVRSDILDKEVIEKSSTLKIAVRAGAGYDNIDLEACSAKGIVVMNTPGQNSNAVGELALGMMVFAARNKFTPKAGTELKGKTIGMHAFGYVGKVVARICKGFGMDVLAYDPFIDKVDMEINNVVPVASVEELYKKCQYISLHIPANKDTKESINYELMSKMPKGATLVNTARKEVIHEPSLLKMFAEREDFVYLTDVAPDCGAEIEAKYADRYFATPKKMAAQTKEANVNAGLAAAKQIVNFFNNGDTTFQVNK